MMKRCLVALSLLLGLWSSVAAQQPDTRPHASNLRFNKLRIGTLVNCGTNNFVTGFDPRTSAPVCAQPSLSMLSDASNVVTTTGTQKVFGKQNVPRVVPLAIVGTTPPTVTLNCDTTDIGTLDAIASDITIGVPTCTGTNPESEQEIEYRFRSSTPRLITWNAIFCEENNVPLLAQTTGDGVKFNRIKFRRNTLSSCWGVIANPNALARGVTTLGSSATLTCNAQVAAQCQMTNTATAGTGVLIAAPTGTLTDGLMVMILVRCQNAQTLTYHASFVDSPGLTRPTACSTSSTIYTVIGARYNLAATVWQILAATQ